HDLGLGRVWLPASEGGAGLGFITAVLLEEGLAGGDPAAPFALAGPGGLGFAVTELGTEAQAKSALAPFLHAPHPFGPGAVGRGGGEPGPRRVHHHGNASCGRLPARRRQGVRPERGPRVVVRAVRSGGYRRGVARDRGLRRRARLAWPRRARTRRDARPRRG